MNNLNPYTLQPYFSDNSLFEKTPAYRNFYSNVYNIFKSYYIGLPKILKITGKLAEIWLDFQRALVEFGRIAIVEYGSEWLLARITKGERNKKGGWKGLRLCFLGDEETEEFEPYEDNYVIFEWNSDGKLFSLANCEYELQEIWKTKRYISWDQKRSRKTLSIRFQRNPGPGDLKPIEQNLERGYLVAISPGKTANEIQEVKWFETRNSAERQQLWKDKDELWSEMCLILGIRHNPFAKEERQNNPEVRAGQVHFDNWENERLECLVKGILQLQSKSWGKDTEVLIKYGSLEPCWIMKSQCLNNLNEEQVQQLLFSEKINNLNLNSSSENKNNNNLTIQNQ